jgi:hypothetical protein
MARLPETLLIDLWREAAEDARGAAAERELKARRHDFA